MLIIGKSIPSPLWATEKTGRQKRMMNRKCQLVNFSGRRRCLTTNQPTQKSWNSMRSDLEHPLSILNLTQYDLKLAGTTATRNRPTAITPVVHLIGMAPSCTHLSR